MKLLGVLVWMARLKGYRKTPMPRLPVLLRLALFTLWQ